MSLEMLERQVHSDLERLSFHKSNWVPVHSHPEGQVYDCVVVGGGQSGLGTLFALQQERISNIVAIDENPQGFEGPWETYARMVTLRTPKELTSIDLGIPSLTFRAYWEALHGPEGWAALNKIPRGDWMAYLRWYRKVLRLPVLNEVRLTLIEPTDEGVFRLHIEGSKAPGSILLARKVVLATGIQGGGEWHVPPMIADAIPRDRYAHTSEAVDIDRWKGKVIGIIGAGASSFDNAHYALTHGVSQVHVFVRRKDLPRVNPIRHMEATGMIPRYAALSDSDKYRIMASFFRHNQPPTNDTFERASACPGFELHLDSPICQIAFEGDQVVLSTPHRIHKVDFLIVSTGLITDPALRPELRLIEKDILRWRDRYRAPDHLANPLIDEHPYLDESFGYLGRDEASTQRLKGIFAFNYSALINFGLSASALSGLKYAIPRLAKGIADQLFLEDRDTMLDRYHSYSEPEFVGSWPRPGTTQ